ncbi:hypothetical protein EDI_338270 [Entamoeba dispar SAW760]|uniref:Uncharacterized protein n=1 Tax=Entamoeba dispar (strain ATCC PRA-260 / SAW760) TaxID=370354 RepID=B0EA87_ENTDS|nr:uncharacterized protein EDI_338270 [Entamoeba dispar SAW760]EDR28574.1 hypothetical protein EDI_338270 [Entamoeba dispar SAW760]|eukprot:EDR28574.1 hypothetical protein EDI_338270 [Entamoeba dispar SAW760]
MSSSDLSYDIVHSLPSRAYSSSYSSDKLLGRSRHKPLPSEYISMFTGFFVVEFDLEDGEVIIFKQLSNELNNGVEKELVRVLMGCDYSADTNVSIDPKNPPKERQNLILTHSIMNFHCISVHFSVFNPSNKRGYVSTICISILQSRQFSCQQAKFVKEELQKCSKQLQEISYSYWNGTTQIFESPLTFSELINIALQSQNGLNTILTSTSKIVLNSHINTSYDSYFSNITSPSTVLTLGNFALCNSSFNKPIPHDFPFPPIFPLYQPSLRSQISAKYSFNDIIETMPKLLPHLILTILSGCRITIFQSIPILNTFKLKEIADFLTSLCIGGVSCAHYSPILNDDKSFNGQILVTTSNTFTGNDAALDLSKGFKGLFYEGKGLLDNFISYTKEGGQFLEERYWNIVLDYWGLTVRCLAGESIPTSQDKYVIQNFIRRVEIEREANKTGRIVPKIPIFSPTLFKFIPK